MTEKRTRANKDLPPLLPRIAEGDSEATQEFITRYKSLIWWLARKLAPSDAEDAAQEVFIELWKNAAKFDASRASESTFVAMVARRRLIDHFRKSQRQVETSPIEDTDPGDHFAAASAVESVGEVALARRAIANLRPDEQKVLMLSIHLGLSHSEIADKTGLPIGTVKTFIRRSLIRIRAELEARNAKGLEEMGEGAAG